jgi:hypothetical protein
MLKRKKKQRPLVNGKPIRFRFAQQLGWTGMSALFGVGFVAGVYYLVLQQRYPFLPGSGSLKLWWDDGMNGLVRSPHWAAYRHAIRDNGEPAAWSMVGAIILGKAKIPAPGKRPYQLPTWALIAMTLTMLVLIIAGATGIAWLTVLGPPSHWSDIFSWQQFVFGLAFGQLLHRLFASPVGVTIRNRIIYRSVVIGRMPLWVQFPFAPPAWREMWSELNRRDTNPTLAKEDRKGLKRFIPPAKFLVPAMVLVFVIVAVIGDCAKFLVAHGIHVPGMTS